MMSTCRVSTRRLRTRVARCCTHALMALQKRSSKSKRSLLACNTRCVTAYRVIPLVNVSFVRIQTFQFVPYRLIPYSAPYAP